MWYARIMDEEEHKKAIDTERLWPSQTRYEWATAGDAYEAGTVVFLFETTEVSLDTIRSLAEQYCLDGHVAWILLFRMAFETKNDMSQEFWEGSVVHSGIVDLSAAIERRWLR